MIKVLVYPKNTNPYQELLYRELDSSIEIHYLELLTKSRTVGLSLLYLQLLYWRVLQFNIIHLHWIDFALPYSNLYFSRVISLINTLFVLTYLKILRYRVVWTVHNIIPHEPLTINDKLIVKYLSKLASSILVHSINTKSELAVNEEIQSKTIVTPHGNYISEYPNIVSKSTSRRYLGLPSKAFVYSSVGYIRPYKRLEDLITTYISSGLHSTSYLLIAGSCIDNEYLKKLTYLSSKYNRIIIKSGFIPDNFLQYYYNASDIVVIQYKEFTTSGSAILSASFGLPLILPKLELFSQFPKKGVIFYEYNNQSSLAKSMVHAYRIRSKLSTKGRFLSKYISTQTWDLSTNIVQQMYNKL